MAVKVDSQAFAAFFGKRSVRAPAAAAVRSVFGEQPALKWTPSVGPGAAVS